MMLGGALEGGPARRRGNIRLSPMMQQRFPRVLLPVALAATYFAAGKLGLSLGRIEIIDGAALRVAARECSRAGLSCLLPQCWVV